MGGSICQMKKSPIIDYSIPMTHPLDGIIRVNTDYGKLTTTDIKDLSSLQKLLQNAFSKHEETPFLYNPMDPSGFLNRTIVYKRIKLLGQFLRKREIQQVYVKSQNCYELVIIEFTCVLYGIEMIPLYNHYKIEHIRQILELGDIDQNKQRIIFLDLNNFHILYDQYLQQCRIKIVTFQQIKEIELFGDTQESKQSQNEVIYFQDILLTEDEEQDLNFVPKETLLYSYFDNNLKKISYTQENFNVAMMDIQYSVNNTPDDTLLIFPEQYEIVSRLLLFDIFLKGGRVVFADIDENSFIQSLGNLQPTILLVNQRVLQVIQQFFEGLQGQFNLNQKEIFRQGIEYKSQLIKEKGEFSCLFYDRLFFTYQMMFGGKIRLLLGSESSIEQKKLLCSILSCPFIDVITLPEISTGIILIQNALRPLDDNLGGPAFSVETKMEDDYLLVRSPACNNQNFQNTGLKVLILDNGQYINKSG